jgi:hypothetical protein
VRLDRLFRDYFDDMATHGTRRSIAFELAWCIVGLSMAALWWLRAAAPVQWLHRHVSPVVPDAALTAIFGVWCALGIGTELLRLRRAARRQ